MDLTNNKACIISVGVGGHYPIGVNRLERSLNFVGWAGGQLMWREYPEGCPPHEGDHQYNFKIYAFEKAFQLGYTVVLWADCSLWAVANPMPIFDYVNDNGLYFFKSGYSLAETATDKLLYHSGELRDSLTDVSEFATGLVGINIENPKGKQFFEGWKAKMEAGLFGGNRWHDKNDSEHPLFKFSRQDQSAASMVLHQMGITSAGEDRNFQAYWGTPYDEKNLIFFIQGI